MNDFNRGALPVPCLRLDYGFGEQWASVELGDGTGYVRLADYEKVVAENAKMRELLVGAYEDMNAWQMVIAGSDQWGYGKGCLERLCELRDAMRELVMEVGLDGC